MEKKVDKSELVFPGHVNDSTNQSTYSLVLCCIPLTSSLWSVVSLVATRFVKNAPYGSPSWSRFPFFSSSARSETCAMSKYSYVVSFTVLRTS